MRIRSTLRAGGAIAALALAASLAACAPSGSEGASTEVVSQADIDAAMKEPTTITYWSFLDKTSLDKIGAAFKKKYPAMTVKVENPAPDGRLGKAVRTALEAGSGIPDVVSFSTELPSFIVTGDVLDLTKYGAADLKDDFVPSAWEGVTLGDAIWGLPQDAGPVGVLYRKDLLDAAGITTPPATWEEFADDAEAYHKSTGKYLTNLSMTELNIMISQVGEQQFQWDGDRDLKIAIDTPESRKVIAYMQDLIDRGIVSTDAEFVDSYYQGTVAGKYASWITAAWGPTFLQGVAADTAGKWEAAPLPQWEDGEERNPTLGGSKLGVMAKSEHPIQAAKFAEFLTSDPEATKILADDLALFPATTAQLADPEWQGEEDPFFGGQKVNAFWQEIAAKSTTTLESPFGTFLAQAEPDTIVAAMTNGDRLQPAWTEYDKKVVDYATSQGFNVTSK